jgi:hypothetical protein
MKDLDTKEVAEAKVHDYVRHPFKTFFKGVARAVLTLLLLGALAFVVGVFALGLVGIFTNFGMTGVACVGLSFGILMAYVITLDRREATQI